MSHVRNTNILFYSTEPDDPQNDRGHDVHRAFYPSSKTLQFVKSDFHPEGVDPVKTICYCPSGVNELEVAHVRFTGMPDRKYIVITDNPCIAVEAELLKLPCIPIPKTSQERDEGIISIFNPGLVVSCGLVIDETYKFFINHSGFSFDTTSLLCSYLHVVSPTECKKISAMTAEAADVASLRADSKAGSAAAAALLAKYYRARYGDRGQRFVTFFNERVEKLRGYRIDEEKQAVVAAKKSF